MCDYDCDCDCVDEVYTMYERDEKSQKMAYREKRQEQPQKTTLNLLFLIILYIYYMRRPIIIITIIITIRTRGDSRIANLRIDVVDLTAHFLLPLILQIFRRG